MPSSVLALLRQTIQRLMTLRSLLRSAGISRVRLDFSPGDESKPANRLLERLCAEQFQITLHLVQARDEARRMLSKEAGEAWRKFGAGNT